QLTIAEAEALTARAEELGIDGVFVPDHILAKPATTQHYGGHWPDPFSLLAYLAGRTRRIRLGASVIVLPYRNALVAAKAAATVDLGRRLARIHLRPGSAPLRHPRRRVASPGAQPRRHREGLLHAPRAGRLPWPPRCARPGAAQPARSDGRGQGQRPGGLPG